MAFDCEQFRGLVKKILVDYPALYSPAAVNLLLATAAVESDFGTFLEQHPTGPGQGIFQMEPKTYQWLHEKYGRQYMYLVGRPSWEMIWNLKLAILMARLRYRIVPEPLPDAGDVFALAEYWKKHYNTELGKGTVQEFIQKYHKYVKEA